MTRIVKAKRPQPLAAGSLPRGYVRLACGDPALDLIVLLGAEAPQVTGGVGGWTVTPRPQAVGMTLWEGVEPYQVNLSLMLDGWATGQSQESALRSLRRVARGDAESPPGVLYVEGIPLPASRWVIEGIDFGDPILGTDAARLRQPLTLTLRQYVPPKFLKRKRSAYGSSSKSAIVRAQHGDTPAKIAKRRRLKSWTVIRDLNRKLKLKANSKLKAGQKLRVPATKTQARSGGKDHKRHR
jgi:hypothetical protein